MHNENIDEKKTKKPFYKSKLLWFGLIAYLIFVIFNIGLRLTPLQAAQKSPHIDNRSILMGEVVKEPYHIFFYENADEYRTVVAKPWLMFWKSEYTTYNYKYDDVVKTVGGFSITDAAKNTAITTIPVRNYDSRVAYIEMGPEPDRKRMDALYGEIVVFSWDKGYSWYDLNAIAYSVDGKPLYLWGNRMEADKGVIPDASKIRWISIDTDTVGVQ